MENEKRRKYVPLFHCKNVSVKIVYRSKITDILYDNRIKCYDIFLLSVYFTVKNELLIFFIVLA